MMMSSQDWQRVLGPLQRRIIAMLQWASVERVDESGDLQKVQLTVRGDDDVLDECERVGQYGLSSSPVPGAAVILAFMGAHASNPVVLGVDDARYRIKNLASGEVALYNNVGTVILLKSNGDVDITTSGQVSISGNLHVSGDVTIGGQLNGHAP